MHPPVPMCYHDRGCIEDFVVMSYRVWSPPPLWAVSDYAREFGAWHTPYSNVTIDDLAFIVLVEGGSGGGGSIQGIEGTWATSQPRSMDITYVVSAPPRADVQQQKQQQAQGQGHRVIVAGVGVAGSPDDDSGSGGVGGDGTLGQQQRTVRGLIRAYTPGVFLACLVLSVQKQD